MDNVRHKNRNINLNRSDGVSNSNYKRRQRSGRDSKATEL